MPLLFLASIAAAVLAVGVIQFRRAFAGGTRPTGFAAALPLVGIALLAFIIFAFATTIADRGLIRTLIGVFQIGVAAGFAFVSFRLLVSMVRVYFQRRRDKAAGQLAPLFRDTKVIAILAQVAFLVGAIIVVAFLWNNFVLQADKRSMALNFNFLDEPGGYSIADNPLHSNDSVSEAIVAGFMNTVRVIIVGIPLSIALGTMIGIARLGNNWLVARLATGYVEFFRNLPPVIVIVFVWGLFLSTFPQKTMPWKLLGGWFIFSNERFAFPSFIGYEGWDVYRWVLLAGAVIGVAVAVWRTRVFNQTGHAHHRLLYGLGAFAVVAVIGYVALGQPLGFSKPVVSGDGNDRIGGIWMQMSYAALIFGLSLYTASHVAEIVRGSILAVDRGQVEAAEAVALSGFQRYRFVILPQAFRVAFPALINQFLNFTKNSSLGFAIAFAEITSVIQNLQGQSRPSAQLILILMLTYLTLSLLLSAFGNIINRRLQIVGR